MSNMNLKPSIADNVSTERRARYDTLVTTWYDFH